MRFLCQIGVLTKNIFKTNGISHPYAFITKNIKNLWNC